MIPELILCESVLPTRHGRAHARAGKRVRTYQAMIRSGTHEGIPLYDPVRGWHEEDPAAAKRAGEKALKKKKKR